MKRWRFPRKEIIEAVGQLSELPIWVLCGAVTNQRTAEYTHFIRIGFQTKSIEVGLTDQEAHMPVHELTEKHLRSMVNQLAASIDPNKINILAAG